MLEGRKGFAPCGCAREPSCEGCTRGSELKAQVDVECHFVSQITVSHGGSQRAEHRVIEIGQFTANVWSFAQQISWLLGVEAQRGVAKHIVVAEKAELSRDTSRQEMALHVFKAHHASERHLLLYQVAEPIASKAVASYYRNLAAKEHTPIHHGPDGKLGADGK